MEREKAGEGKGGGQEEGEKKWKIGEKNENKISGGITRRFEHKQWDSTWSITFRKTKLQKKIL